MSKRELFEWSRTGLIPEDHRRIKGFSQAQVEGLPHTLHIIVWGDSKPDKRVRVQIHTETHTHTHREGEL